MNLRNIIGLLLITLLACISCKKADEKPNGNINPEITIDSITASSRQLIAWDTTKLVVYASGDELQFSWKANHGDIHGRGQTVSYSAGQCCVGLNTITVRAYNRNGFAEDTIQIRITPYIINP